MSDNHAVHFTNSLMSHVQCTAHMATLFRATATGGLSPHAASYARPAEVPSMLRPNMPAAVIPGNRSENAPGDLTGDVARGVTGDMAVPVNLSAVAASDWQAALRPLIGAAVAAPIHDSRMAAPAAARARALVPTADRSSHLLAGTLRPAPAVVAAAAQTAQAAQAAQIEAVRPHAVAPADGLASGYALQQGATRPGSIVQRAGLPQVDPLPGQPASEDIGGDANWRRLRAIVQAHNAAPQPAAAAASPVTTAARQAPQEGLLTVAKPVQADSALPGGPGALARFEAVVESPAPPLEQPLSRSAPLRRVPEAGTTLAGLGPQAASGPQKLLGQVEDLYARAQDEWQGLPEKDVDRFTFAQPETDLQAVPLQADWPVDHAALADADVPGMPQAGAASAISAFLPQPSLAESLQAALAPIATGQPTSSPVDIVTPRRLRPAALPDPNQAPTADAEPVAQALERLYTLQQHTENDRPLSAAFATPPAVPPTPMPLIAGENNPPPPADLWRLIGLEPPAAAGVPSSQVADSARSRGQDLQPAPQPDRQAFGAQPTGDTHGTADSTAYVAGGTGRLAERVSGTGPTPASDGQKQHSSAELDLDLLAHAVYVHLHRRLLADQERLHLR